MVVITIWSTMPYTKDVSVYKRLVSFKKENTSSDGAPSLYLMVVRRLGRTRSGVSNPNWKQQVHDHKSATTTLQADWASLNTKRGYIVLRCRDPIPPGTEPAHRELWGELAAQLISTQPTHLGWSSKADARATAKFYSQVKEAQQKLSGPTFLGELRETLRMLKKPAAGLWNGVERYAKDLEKANRLNRRRYFKKDPKRYARNLTQTAGELWLERAFGWMPFLNDIQGAKDAHNALFEQERVEHLSAGGQDMKDLISSSLNNVGFNLSLWMNYRQVDITRQTIRYRGAVRAQAATTAADRLALFGFQPREFVPTAWELLPWSFLIDYFANIGDILNASFTDTSNVIWVSKSNVTTTWRKLQVNWDMARIAQSFKAYGVTQLDGQPGSAAWTYKTMSRGSTGVPSIPSLNFTIPRSPGQLANVAALLAAVGLSTHPQKLSGRNYRL